MTLISEIPKLTTALDQLTEETNVSKATLDAKVSAAEAQTSLSQTERGLAEGARDQASAHATDAATHLATVKTGVSYEGIAEILATKTQNAVDVFIYDTSLDSDGGAWRKRCQHLSWFNEELNTNIRGSRREFPAVTIIVAESSKVTIYDADDPALPMWMVFEARTGNGFLGDCTIVKTVDFNPGVYCRNGQMIMATTLGADAACFVADEMKRYPSLGGVGGYEMGIAKRTSPAAASGDIPVLNAPGVALGVGLIVSPTAPIDPKTSLPVPHILAGGDSFSIVLPNGSIYAVGGGSNEGGLSSFSRDGSYIAITRSEDGNNLQMGEGNIAYVNAGGGNSSTGIFTFDFSTDTLKIVADGNGKGEPPFSDKFAFNGILLNPNLDNNTFICGYDTDYTTGWIPEDTRNVLLADTDPTNLVGAELGVNSSFDLGETGWINSFGTDGVDFSVTGQVTITEQAGVDRAISQTLTGVKAGQRVYYEVDAAVSSGMRGAGFRLGYDGNTTPYVRLQQSGEDQVESGFFVAQSDDPVMVLHVSTTDQWATVRKAAFFAADSDRWIYNLGLVAEGTITRTPVAPGAELVGYSGFRNTAPKRYLYQPNNPALDFGTGDFSIMFWVKDPLTSSTTTILQRPDDAGFGLYLWRRTVSSTGALNLTVGNSTIEAAKAAPANKWTHAVMMRKDGELRIFLDGELSADGVANTYNVVSDQPMYFGINSSLSGSDDNMEYALVRISGTAPTPEQIAKIYEDERKLFQPNAKCTLYGTSSGVTALAHDPKTNLLHVGTNQGRSVFDGLVRVDNTETPVTTAISAVNGMILEQ